LAVANGEQGHAIASRFAHQRDDVDIARAWRGGNLLRLQFAQAGQLITQARGQFKLQCSRSARHPRAQLLVYGLAPTREHLKCRVQVTPIVCCADQSHARRSAAADLILQAGPAAMSKERIPTVADPEHFLQLHEHVLDRVGARKRSE